MDRLHTTVFNTALYGLQHLGYVLAVTRKGEEIEHWIGVDKDGILRKLRGVSKEVFDELAAHCEMYAWNDSANYYKFQPKHSDLDAH